MPSSTGTFETSDGHHLFERHWAPEGDAPRAHLVIVHGYAEHSGRYEHVGAYFAGRGYAVHAYDLRGHGLSDGERVLVRSMAEHLDDLDTFLTRVQARAGTAPIFLLGHSMGGGIVALAMVTRRPQVRGVLLSGAVLPRGGIGQAVVGRALMLLGRLAPRLRLRELAAETVSRDSAVVALYDSDPLNYRGKMPAGTVAAMVRASRVIDKRMETILDPLLIMHGTADALAQPDGSRRLYYRIASIDKTLKLYEGLYHEILNEPEQRQVMDDMAAWMDARSTSATRTAPAASDAAS
ncbi:MAG: lysophospholipase [Chloroflexota bacterium]|nr:lysophospholipase [Chloroflexota bacterium]